MAPIFNVKRGGVVLPPWFHGLRVLQLVFALVVAGLTAYALSIHNGSLIRPALILTIITAILTIIPIFPFTISLSTPLVHPLGTLASDFIGTLLWLASLVALASYLRIFSYYRKVENIPWASGAPKIARAWRCGLAACVFAAIELLLFLLTLKLFAYFYHHHRAGSQPHASLLRGAGRPRETESFSLQNNNAAAAPPPTSTGFAQQQPMTSNITPLTSPLHSAAPHAHSNNNNIPSITTTAATPTAAAHQPAGGAFASPRPSPYEPGQGTGYASPIIPDPESVARAGEKARPPYPVDEDEEMGVVGKGQRGQAQNGGVQGVPTRGL